MEDLLRLVKKLETHLIYLEEKHGDELNHIRDIDGRYIVAPILTALTNAYAALLTAQL
jgi:hypothetical protein